LNVVILAAGKGKRMHSDLAQGAAPAGRQALLAHVIATARQLGAARICVVYGHGGEQVREALDAPDLSLGEAGSATGHRPRRAAGDAASGAVSSAPTLVLYGDVPLTAPPPCRP
jgi:bifunctional UDP-N-acetylglucosamine pyrophosphorylase/glucosamine-1-phosphate N-acetyltransferase